MIVADGSALVFAVADTTERGARVRSRLADGAIAPHLVDAEVGQAIRGLVRRRLLEPAAAERSLMAAEHLVLDRYPHPALRPQAWELRDNISFYDGLYVSLAERAGLTLLTADARLAAAPRVRCEISLV